IALAQNVAINDGDFDNPDTWLIEVPQDGDEVIIGNNSDVTLMADTELAEITINGGTLTLNNFKLTLTEGTLNLSSGSVIPGTGTIEYASASGTVCVQPLTYYHLLVSGSGTKQLCGDIVVNGDLQINGDPTLDANGFNINLLGNWNSAVSASFTPQANQVTFSGSAAQTISKTGGGTEAFNNLIINKAANDVTINEGNVQVNNTLDLTAGDLILGTHNLIVNSSSNAAILNGGATSYINNEGSGYLQHGVALSNTYNLPVGGATEYAPITFTLNSASLSSSSIRVTQTDAPHPARDNATIYLTRYWTINPIGITGSIDYDLTLQYPESDVEGDETTFRMAKYSSGSWTESEGTEILDAGNNTVTWNGITSFSDYTLLGNGTVLPVVWEEFRAVADDEVVHLFWTTSEEVNNDYFTIERSLDGQTWEALTDLPGRGFSQASVAYDWVDNSPASLTSYYRIRQTDFDGQWGYSPIRTVFMGALDLNISAYPNPVPESGLFNVAILGATPNSEVRIQVLDLTGRMIANSTGETNTRGQWTHELQLPREAPTGAYLLLIELDGQIHREKLMLR
ncbi:MAG: T9SS type A sorting domain-containing protein, partial [Bacteroidota bacterium]